MADALEVVNNDQYAEEIAESHFELEPGLSLIVKLESPTETLRDEPLKLLEVNSNGIPAGIMPLHFPGRLEGKSWYPPVVIVEVTPEEFADIRKNPALLPNGWRMTREFKRAG